MAKLAMDKIEIVALLSDSQKIIERLQRRGVVELQNVEGDGLDKLETAASVAVFEKNLAAVKTAREILGPFHQSKKSLLAALSGRPRMSTEAFAEKKDRTGETLVLVSDVAEHDRTIRETQTALQQNRVQEDLLTPWRTYPYPGSFAGTKSAAVLTGSFPKVWEETALERSLEERTGVSVTVDLIGIAKGQSIVSLTIFRDDLSAVEVALREMEFAPAQLPRERTAAEELSRLEKEDQRLLALIDSETNALKEAAKHFEDLEFLEDYLVMRMDKYRALEEVATTESTIVIRGYVPAKFGRELQEEFESRYTVAITLTPATEEDDAPVLLENGRFSAPLESVTEMYALPGKKDPDPSPIMAFFYYLLFGMMLSDAGYGLMMVIGTVVILARVPLEERMKNTMRLFRNCGISTLFWGILFGSWWGDLPQIIGKNFFGTGDFSTALWFEPIDDPIRLLLFSFLIGILHLFLGVAVKGAMLWKEGKRIDALCETIPIYLTILGVMPTGAGIFMEVPAILSQIGSYVMLVGVALLILTGDRSGKNVFARLFGGLYTLYNAATGWLGDILSYSRLLALGLATGSIAGVVNLICAMPGNLVLKAITLLVVGTAVHVANLAINLLGAYVHSDRLQFVELFSKFYEGGGRAFAPLKANTKNFRFEKENIYHG